MSIINEDVLDDVNSYLAQYHNKNDSRRILLELNRIILAYQDDIKKSKKLNEIAEKFYNLLTFEKSYDAEEFIADVREIHVTLDEIINDLTTFRECSKSSIFTDFEELTLRRANIEESLSVMLSSLRYIIKTLEGIFDEDN